MNQSRTYYTIRGAAENIYVYKPAQPFGTYFFEVIDYLGLKWGYLESVINVGGVDRVCERWSLNVTNDIPFTWTWGKAYDMRLVCDRGTYDYGTFVAGATYSFTLAVTSDMFPLAQTDINGLAVSAQRNNTTWIQVFYQDIYSHTNWTDIAIYQYSYGYNETVPVYTYNSSSQVITVNWLEAASDTDYLVQVEILHNTLGVRYWTFSCPAPTLSKNPFGALAILGTFPFAADQVPAVCILVAIALCFSWAYVPIGMITEIIVAAILVWLGWFAVSWAWLTLSACIIVLLALSEAKKKEGVFA
jgi:hypothetical protein